jgi:hypothetical protein
MKMPEGARAIIDPQKLIGYSLSLDHEEGKNKARVFGLVLGIELNNARVLIDALRDAAASEDAVVGKADCYGQRYVIDFDLSGPGGTALVRSCWIIRANESIPRLVTCYII